MRELVACWQSTRMIVLIGLCSALYAVVFFMFSWIPIIPGLTQFRPAASLPIVFSIFFGPAAAWGSAFGNILGDLISGTIGPGSLFGLLGNLIYGYAPYRVVRAFTRSEALPNTPVLVLAILTASGFCAVIISIGVQGLDIFPFSFLANVILINNIVMSLLLAPLLIRLLGARIQQMKLSYTQVMGPAKISRPLLGKAGVILALFMVVAIYVVMMWPGLGQAFSGNNTVLLVSSLLLTVAGLVLL